MPTGLHPGGFIWNRSGSGASPVVPNILPADLPDIVGALFRANWRDTIRLSTTYQTMVVHAPTTLAEERLGLAGRPARTMEATLNGFGTEECRALLFALMREGTEPRPFPLYPDAVWTTAATSNYDVPADTSYRRFFPGQRIAIVEHAGHEITNVEFALIAKADDALDGANIEVQQLLSKTYPAGTLVLPMVDALVRPDQEVRPVTDGLIEVRATFEEAHGFSAMPASVEDGDQSGLSNLYTDAGTTFPVWEPGPNWNNTMRVFLTREGRSAPAGRGQFVYGDGDRPRFRFAFEMLTFTRAEFWEILQLFDYCSGRLRPVMLANPVTIMEASDADTTWIEIAIDGEKSEILEFLTHVYVTKTDGTKHVRKISSVQNNSDNASVPVGYWRLNLDQAVSGLSSSTLRHVTSAHKVRFDDDTLTEDWSNTEVCTTAVGFTEVIEEADVSISDITPVFPV